MKNWSKQILTSGSLLMASMMVANVLNLLFNIYLGRKIDLGDYSTVAIINTMWYFITIFIGALSATLVQRVAFLSTKYNVDAANFFFKTTRNRAILVVSVITGLYIVASPVLQVFFHLSSSAVLILIAPSLVAGMLLSLNSSYLTANLLFKYVAVLNLVEPVIKFAAAIAIVSVGLEEFAFLSIPISVLGASVLSILFIKSKVAKTISKHIYHFPKGFYFAALLSGLSSNAFLVYDISLVKHYLSPQLAGEYALLALVGKMIFFMGSLVNTFMLVLVTRDIAANRNPNKTFYRLMAGIIVLVIGSALCLGLFGAPFVILLFKDNALPIIPHLQLYSFTIAVFTIANAVVGYHLARKHYVFPIVAIIFSLGMVLGIFFYHTTITQIVQVMAVVAVINLVVMICLHFLQKEGGFFIRNFLDLIALALPLPKAAPLKNGKRILIFNWRDMLHVYAGGAEVYVHELAKRWVQKGNAVTLFCGNDGHNPRNEEIDGVYVVRRGGFYMVFVWGFLYYMLRFRGQYDVILDCENGLPFFTPFYAKEKIFLVIHHVHQGVFKNSLNPILGAIASFLEMRVMPLVYKNIKVITVSPSSKRDIMEFELTLKEPEIVYNGIDLQKYKPGRKSFNPLVLYMGRLKQYKTIDVMIKAAKIVTEKMPEAEFIIAGEGEEKSKLMKLVSSLHLEDKVQFLGRVTEEQKIKLLQKAWVAVNPSSMEGWGITVIEANACGTPVVASRVPGLMDSVKNPHTGYLVEYGNVEEFAEKILHVLQNTQKRDDLSQQAIEWSQKFDWDKSATKSLVIFAK